MNDAAVWIARLSCGCAIDACEEGADHDELAMCLYHWTGNGYTVERIDGGLPIALDCAACREQSPRATQRMFL
jgi:hypothetical protein